MKMKARERLLSANAIGNVKLAQTAETYADAISMVTAAQEVLADLKRSLLSAPEVAVVVNGGVEGVGPVVVTTGPDGKPVVKKP